MRLMNHVFACLQRSLMPLLEMASDRIVKEPPDAGCCRVCYNTKSEDRIGMVGGENCMWLSDAGR